MNELMRKLKIKYNNLSLPIKASLWFTICNFMQRGITMITTPFFTRLLSEEEYGIFSIYTSWQGVLLMLTSLSLYKSIMNLYIKNDDKEKVLSVITGLSIIVTGIWLVISIAFASPFAKYMGISKALVISLFVSFIAQSIINCWSVYERYVYSYKKLIIITLLLTALSSFLGLFCVIFISDTAMGRVLPQTIVMAFVGLYLGIDIFRRSNVVYEKSMWIFSLSFCVGLLPHYLSEFVLQSSDKLMINYMCGSKDVAMYSIAYSVGMLINLVTSAINSSFGPYQYQKIKDKQYNELATTANRVLVLVSVMLCLLMLLSKEIVLIFGGVKYLESAKIIVPICLGVYFNYLFQLFARAQEYFERKLTIVVPSIICALLNLFLNYIFIKRYGYQAASYTTFACYLVFCIVHYFFYVKVCREEMAGENIYDIKGMLGISLITILAGFGIMFINQLTYIRYLFIVGIVLFILKNRSTIITFFKIGK